MPAGGCDDRTIAYAKDQDIYEANKGGTQSRKVLTVPGFPSDLKFSPDSAKLRFTLRRPRSNHIVVGNVGRWVTPFQDGMLLGQSVAAFRPMPLWAIGRILSNGLTRHYKTETARPSN